MSPDDGAMVAELGADQIGVVVGEHGRAWDAVGFAAANGILSAIKTAAPQRLVATLREQQVLSQLEGA
jgi:hypothetical protein